MLLKAFEISDETPTFNRQSYPLMEKKDTSTEPLIFFHLSPEEQLDKILSFIIVKDTPLVQDKDIMLSFDTHYVYLYEILDRLKLDGYIKNDSPKVFSITFNGRIFFNNGGYKEQKRIANLNKKVLEQTERLSKRNEKSLVIATWLAGFAALLLLGWQIFLYYKSCSCGLP